MSSLPQKMRSALIRARYYERAKAHSRAQTYSCFLDEFPDTTAAAALDLELITNSSYHYQPDGQPPAEILQGEVPLDAFLGGHPLAWVKDAGTEIWLPFWARGEWAKALPSLRAGQPAPPELSPHVRRSLVAANILVASGAEDQRRAQWTDLCDTARSRYERDSYVVVSNLLHPLVLAAMRRFYRSLLTEGRLPLGDDQVSGRYVLHSEVLASYYHPQLATVVGRIAGEPVKPSYVYFASYKPGASLPKHVDREQCEFSISFLADYIPEPNGPSGWPLFLDNPRLHVTSAADLAVGDAVFYRGRELAHYRDPLPEGHRSTSLFFHYVRPDFTGELW